MEGLSKVFHAGFEAVPLPDGYFDLVISNFPFGNYPVIDHSLADPRLAVPFTIISWPKACSSCAPAGSWPASPPAIPWTRPGPAIRSWLAARATLLGAVRLPETAFKKNAGTEVVTDVLFLQKKEAEEAGAAPAWVQVVQLNKAGRDPEAEAEWSVNGLYREHPDWILGRANDKGSLYGARSYTVQFEGEPGTEGQALEQKLLEILPRNLLTIGEKPTPAESPVDLTRPIPAKHILPIPEGTPVDVRFRLEALRQLYDTARNLLKLEAEGADDGPVEAIRGELNRIYDRFVAGFGPIGSKVNARLLGGNPAFAFLRALEGRSDGWKTEKAPLFSRRTVRPRWQKREVLSAQDALFVVLDTLGRVDLDRIAALLGVPPEQVIRDLRGLVYQQPDGRWLTADQYLSGNIRAKLSQAAAAAELEPAFKENVTALQAAMPEKLKPGQIKARLGSGWVPHEDMEAFVSELIPRAIPEARFIPALGSWSLEVRARYGRFDTYDLRSKWGTSRMTTIDLLECGLNARTPAVYDPDPADPERRVLNRAETLAAQAKLEEIKARFETWLWEAPERAERLAELYNEKFNGFRPPKFDGSYLSLPGLNTEICLYPYQLDAVCRCLHSKTTLLGHNVGLGKTYAAIVAGMEMLRLGLAHKVLVVVPNHLTGQWEAAIQYAYPTANILCAGKGDLSVQNRGAFLSRIATGDWHFVIVPVSSFRLLPVGDELQKEFFEEECDKLRAYLEELKRDKDAGRARKEIEKALKRFEAKLDAMANMKKDARETILFEQLGTDLLIVDEFHCLPYEARVLTDKGLLPIGEIVEKRLHVSVKSVDLATNQVKWMPVTAWLNNPQSAPMVRVEHEKGSFECTANHKVWTEDAAMLKPENSQPNTHLKVCPTCKRRFKPSSRGKRGQMQVHCSRECQKNGQHKMVTKHCLKCGQKFTFQSSGKKNNDKRRFCGNVCAARWRNAQPERIAKMEKYLPRMWAASQASRRGKPCPSATFAC